MKISIIPLQPIITKIHGKNSFTEISKNLARYRAENYFVGSSK